ncbi:MAG: hypothetical protein JST90_13045 [Bacteroidetes bacterium]|nr:hypothetical protein [Bacteroidota bacterium]
MTVYTLFSYIGIVALLLTLLHYFVLGNKKVLVTFFQNFVGTLFIFSGFVKAVDPMGTSIKMHEYFEAMKIEFFNPISTPLTVAMLVAELSLGVMLLIGWRPKITTSLLLLLNVFFLLLTGYTYLSGFNPTNAFFAVSIVAFILVCAGAIIENGSVRFWLLLAGFATILVTLVLMKFTTLLLTVSFDAKGMKVTDCGCFGDFMKLKPWQTFYKDCILTAMAFVLALSYKQIKPVFSSMLRDGIAGVMIVGSLIFCLYNFVWNEPVIDFRPYAIGEDINANRVPKVPEKKDFTFIYKDKKSGATRDFSMKEISDPNSPVSTHPDDWQYVDRKEVVLDEGIPARISNLFIFNEDGVELTDSLLHDPHYTLVVVAPLLAETHEDAFRDNINPLALAAEKVGVKTFTLTKDLEAAEAFRHKNQTAYPFYTTDDAAIKAMMRSNPGVMLIKNGVVINKWHYKHIPTFEQLNAQYFSK